MDEMTKGAPQENVGILNSNSFDMSDLDTLDGELRDLVARRSVLGPCYRLFYQRPLHLRCRWH